MNKSDTRCNPLANIDMMIDGSGNVKVTLIRAFGGGRDFWLNAHQANDFGRKLSMLGYNAYPIWNGMLDARVHVTYTNKDKPYYPGSYDQISSQKWRAADRADWYAVRLQAAQAKLERAVRLLEGLQPISELDDVYEFYGEEFNNSEDFIKAHRGK